MARTGIFSVLSTKILQPQQKQLLLNSGVSLTQYDAIKIQPVEFLLKEPIVENAIITSKNAAKAIIKENIQIKNCFCVGEKTAALLEENKSKISVTAHNGKELAAKIVKKHREIEFKFFCGNLRREELPLILKENNISFEEIEVYNTELNPKKFQQEFDGIMFFSPSAVESFILENELKDSIAFCIGTTTASEVRKYTSKIITATKPSIENVIVQVVKKHR